MKAIFADELEKRIQQLPVLSQTVRDILGLFSSQELDFLSLQRKIAQDQALTARILRVANSPFYGFVGQIAALKDACIVLGVHTIRNIVIAGAAVEAFSSAKPTLLDRNALWQHSIATGAAGKILATKLSIDAETAFTGGLLHDIGKLVLDACFPEFYLEVFKFRNEQDCSLRDAEINILGMDHTAVGSRLAEQWKLPTQLIAVIRHHHCPDNIANPLVDVIHIANSLSRALHLGDGGDSLIPEISANAFHRINLDWETIRIILPMVEEVSIAAMQAVIHN